MTRTFEIVPTPEEMAEKFSHMFTGEQVEFIKLVTKHMKNWTASEYNMQLCMIADLLKGERTFINDLYEFIDYKE